MRLEIKKLLKGYDPADLMEQAMYCFGSDGGDGGDGDSNSMGMDDSVADQASTSGTSTGSNDMGMDTSVADQASVQGGMSQGVSGQENSQGSASYGMNTYGTVPSYPQGRNFGKSMQAVDPFGTNPTVAQQMAGAIGIDAFGGIGGASSTQSTAGSQSSAGDMAGGSMSISDPTTGQTTTYSPTQVPSLEMMGKIGFDPFGIQNKVNAQLTKDDLMGRMSNVTKDSRGNVTGVFGTSPSFGLDVTTYTGLSDNPYGEDMSYSGADNDPIVSATRNPVSGQPICPDGYRFDDDLQACRVDTTRTNRPNNPNPYPSGDQYYRATSLDNAPVNTPSGFDFNSANNNFINQFAYRPQNYQNQMGLNGFTPFRRS